MSDAVCAGYLLECDLSLASGLEQRQADPAGLAFSEKKSKAQLPEANGAGLSD
jgi:hypothetical protein